MKVLLNDLRRQHDKMRMELREAFERVVDNSSFIMGEETQKLETEFASYLGIPYALAVSSATDGLQLALMALGVGRGDEVITSPFGEFMTIEAIINAGAVVRFADIDPVTYCLDPQAARMAITSRTKALMPVHIFGQSADLDAYAHIAREHNLVLIEDAAQAHGAKWAGKPVGTASRGGVFSFFPAKNMGALGDAGMVVTADADVAEKIRILRNHGRSLVDKSIHKLLGMKGRMDGMQAAFLRIKLKYLDGMNTRRREIAAYYSRTITHAGVRIPLEAEQAFHVYHLYVVMVEKRDALAGWLKEKGIETAARTPIPLHKQPAYLAMNFGDSSVGFPIAERYSNQALALPCYGELADEEMKYVAECVNAWPG